jgi:hypothetical protein
MPVTRKDFIKLTSVGLLGGLASRLHPASAISASSVVNLNHA